MQNTIEQFYSKSLRKKLLFVQLLLLFVPNVQLFSIPTDNGSISASPCYFFSVVFIPCLLSGFNRMKLPPWYITALYGYVIFWAIIRTPQYGLSKSILHWLFGIYLLVVLLNVGSDFSQKEWENLLETAVCVFAVMHFMFTVTVNRRTAVILLKGYFEGSLEGGAGCYLDSLTRGGRNLDATWLCLGGFFVRGKKKAIYTTWAVLFCFLGGSRAGVVTLALMVLWSLIYDKLYRLTFENLKWYLLYAALMLAVLFGTGMAQAFLSRTIINIPAPAEWIFRAGPQSTGPQIVLSDINMERTLSGRAAIWGKVPQMFRDNPFGYGVGNAMRVMRSRYGFTGFEDIAHNVFMQWLVDEGFIGGLWYIGLAAALFMQQWKNRPRFFEDPFAAYFGVYIILSLVQFHGGEALMIFLLGIYLMQCNARCICFDKLFSRKAKDG